MKKIFSIVSMLLILATLLNACAAASAPPNPKNALFYDDFSQTGSGWTQFTNASGSIKYANDEYLFTVDKPATLFLATPGKTFQEDVSIEVDARKVDGSDDNYIGILCHYQDPNNYYMLLLTSDGYSGIAMRKDGLDTLISPGLKFLKMAGIKTGNKTNHLRADCIGEALTLYANGKQVSLAYNNELTGGDTGLAVRSSSVEGTMAVQFDNFVVNQPSQP